MSQPTTCFGPFQLGHLQVGYLSQRNINVTANHMFRPLLVRPSSGWIPQSEEYKCHSQLHVSAPSSQAIFRWITQSEEYKCLNQLHVSAPSSQAIFRLDTLVRGIQMSQPTTCFGPFQLGHLQVGYLSQRNKNVSANYRFRFLLVRPSSGQTLWIPYYKYRCVFDCHILYVLVY